MEAAHIVPMQQKGIQTARSSEMNMLSVELVSKRNEEGMVSSEAGRTQKRNIKL